MTKSLNENSKTIVATTRTAWRTWLEENTYRETEIWIIFERGKTIDQTLTYEEAVLEGLCFGWIDSIIQRIDERQYARKFTLRKDWQTWSESNRKRIRQLVREGAEFFPGVLERIPYDVLDETVSGPPAPGKDLKEAPEWLTQLFQDHSLARLNFQRLPPSHQRRHLGWILSAKKYETQLRRAQEAVRLLEMGQEIGQK